MPLPKSYTYHFLVALLLAVWLIVFLVLIAPFDIAELPIEVRFEIMPMYGLISFIVYVLLIPLQQWGAKKIGKYPIVLETLFITLYNVLVLLGSYIYYKSSIVNGDYSFIKFTLEVYYPIFFILLPVIIFGRWFVNRKEVPQDTEEIILTGNNKLDILQLKLSDLICVSSADNYVSVSHLVNDVVRTKLLRTTLKKMELQLPELVKVHRSHLINPIHFKEWKDANTLLLTQTEVPVSKNYKKAVLAMNHSSLKTNDSPLS